MIDLLRESKEEQKEIEKNLKKIRKETKNLRRKGMMKKAALILLGAIMNVTITAQNHKEAKKTQESQHEIDTRTLDEKQIGKEVEKRLSFANEIITKEIQEGKYKNALDDINAFYKAAIDSSETQLANEYKELYENTKKSIGAELSKKNLKSGFYNLHNTIIFIPEKNHEDDMIKQARKALAQVITEKYNKHIKEKNNNEPLLHVLIPSNHHRIIPCEEWGGIIINFGEASITCQRTIIKDGKEIQVEQEYRKFIQLRPQDFASAE